MTSVPATGKDFVKQMWKEEIVKAGGVPTPEVPRKDEDKLPEQMGSIRLSTEEKTVSVAQMIVLEKDERSSTEAEQDFSSDSSTSDIKFETDLPPPVVRVRSADTFRLAPGSPPATMSRIGDSPTSTWKQASLKDLRGAQVMRSIKLNVPKEFLEAKDPTASILLRWKEFIHQFSMSIPDIKLEKRTMTSEPPVPFMFNNYGLYPDVEPVLDTDTITCMIDGKSYVLNRQQSVFHEGQIFPIKTCSRFCDATKVSSTTNYQLFAIADGCGLFDGSQKAAQMAVEMVSKEIKRNIDESKKLSIKDIAIVQLTVLNHTIEVLKSFDDIGDTTLLSAIVIDGYLIALSVGDCSLLRIRRRGDSDVAECLSLFDPRISSPKDPGGFLGRHPKLNNLAISIHKLEKGDLLFACTDGVSDNFDPVLTGGKLGHTESTKHGDVDLRQRAAHNKLLSLIGKETDIRKIAEVVQQYVYNLCLPTKLWQLTGKGPTPKDYKKYPGKEDHATMVLFRYEEEAAEVRINRFSRKGK